MKSLDKTRLGWIDGKEKLITRLGRMKSIDKNRLGRIKGIDKTRLGLRKIIGNTRLG